MKQLSEIAVPKDLSKSDGGNDESVQRKGEIRSGYLRQMAIVPILVLFPRNRRVIGAPVPESECKESQRIYPYKVWGEAMCAVVCQGVRRRRCSRFSFEVEDELWIEGV